MCRSRKELHGDGQALLGRSRRRRALGQKGADRLVLAVERRAQVDPALMHLQHAQVLGRREGRIAADLEVVAAGGRIGNNAVAAAARG